MMSIELYICVCVLACMRGCACVHGYMCLCIFLYRLYRHMPDWQTSEPGFESPFATVSKIGHFRPLHWHPSCINEYLAIYSGGNVSDLVLARNCCLARMLREEAELVSEWTGAPGRAKSVKRFERSNGLDTALYKNDLYLFIYCILVCRHDDTMSTP